MKRTVLSATIVLASAMFAFASGQSEETGNADGPWRPSEPIRLIVPWAPGGGTDTVARALAEHGEKHFGVPVVVENVEGGMGARALQRVRNADPDGYELVVASGYVAWIDQVRDFPVNFGDFTKVMAINRDPAAFTVSSDSAFEKIEDVVDYANANPGVFSVGHSGEGLVWHIAGASVADYFDVEFNYVPFDGAAPANAAVMGGQIDAVSVSGAEVASQVLGGEMRALGILGAERVEALPDVPTFAEQGFDLEVYTHRGLVGPAGIPDERVRVLYEGFSAIMEEPKFVDTMNNLGLGIFNLSPGEYSAFVEQQGEQALSSLRVLGYM